MPKRYDAWNSITEYIDEEAIKSYIREKRRSGVRINHMAVIIAAYYKAIQTNPKLNYFVVNSHIYRRNHFSVSFVILKKLADGSPDETTLKIYLEPSDTVFTIQQKITDAIEGNRQHQIIIQLLCLDATGYVAMADKTQCHFTIIIDPGLPGRACLTDLLVELLHRSRSQSSKQYLCIGVRRCHIHQ